jgi:hypothetical protein
MVEPKKFNESSKDVNVRNIIERGGGGESIMYIRLKLFPLFSDYF